MLGALLGYSIDLDYSRIDAQERDRLQAQARIVDENMGRQLEGLNRAMAGVRDEFSALGAKAEKDATSRYLKALGNAIPGLRTIGILDARGMALASSRDELIGRDFSEREFFKIASKRPNPDTLYVSPPFDTALGVFSLNLSRAVIGLDGKLAGVVTSTLAPEYFSILLTSVLYAPGMRATVIHGDGKIVVAEPDRKDLTGMELNAPGSHYTEHVKSGRTANVFAGRAYSTGDQRMSAWRTIGPAALRMDKPLVVSVSRDMAGIFASWRSEAYIQGGLFGALLLVTTLGLYSYQRRRMAHGRVEAEFEAVRKRMEEALRQANADLEERVRSRTAELEKSHQLLRALTGVQESIQEEERKRIARELHDELAQKLTVVKLQIAALMSTPSAGEPGLTRQLQDMNSLLTETMRAVGRIAANLRPIVLDELGLVAALRDLAEQFSERTYIECEFSVHPEDLSVDNRLGVPLYRMVQESLTNVARHAEATEVVVSLHRDPSGRITLDINDNGKGLPSEDQPTRGSFGLIGMRERTAMLGGEMRIQSQPGRGTSIEIVIP